VRSDELKRVRACEHLVAAGHALRQADVSQAHDWVDRALVTLGGAPQLGGIVPVAGGATEHTIAMPRRARLTDRERAVLRLLHDGSLTREGMAESLGITHNTLKSHIGSLYRKLGVQTRAQAIREGNARGLLLPVRTL